MFDLKQLEGFHYCHVNFEGDLLSPCGLNYVSRNTNTPPLQQQDQEGWPHLLGLLSMQMINY